MSNIGWAVDAVVNAVAKAADPLTETQRIALAAALGPVLSQVYKQGQGDNTVSDGK